MSRSPSSPSSPSGPEPDETSGSLSDADSPRPEEPTAAEPTPDEPGTRRTGRRRILAASALGAGIGAVGGMIGGVALRSGAGSPPEITQPHGDRYRDKVVLITGATSGIGRAAAIRFAAEGGMVAFCGRRADRGAEVEARIREAGGEATYIQADVRDESSVREFVAESVATYGRIDVCFNNAGITVQRPLHEYESSEWDDVFNTNVRGVFLALKYQVPHLIEAGGGVVLVTSSSNAVTTSGDKSAYSAAKRALVGLVQSAAFDYADHGIRVNAILPGTTNTELVRRQAGAMDWPDAAWDEAAAVFAASAVPAAKRMATPDEIALFALALAGDDFPYLTGAQLSIDGGKSAYAA